MRVQHNIAALNSYRNFSTNNSKLNKNLEKLSTGYKINRAGDDAAGLAISEKMRAQISGIDGATKNAKDGISLIQTAEGALTEVHDMLNRMTTLAEQSANGTYDDEVDRVQLQKEVDALKSEIDRIADSTNYNGLKLLDGSLSEKSTTTIQEAANTGKQIVSISGGEGTANALAATGTNGDGVIGFQAATKATYTVAGAANQGLGTVTGGALTATAGSMGAVKISFTDKEGVDRELTLNTTTISADGAGKTVNKDDVTVENLVKSLTGESDVFKFDGLNEDEYETINALRDAFSIEGTKADGTAAADNTEMAAVKFTAKEAGSQAKINGLQYKEATTLSVARDITLSTAADNKDLPDVVDSKPEGYEIDLDDTKIQNNNPTLTIGGRTYEFNNGNNIGSNADGVANTVVKKGDDSSETIDNLVKALAKDGIDAVKVKNGNGDFGIRFTDASQISETQSGANISSSTDHLAIVDQAATKQTVSVTVGTATAASHSFRIRYTDASGEIKDKSFSYTATADSEDDAELIAAALNNDSELKDLFDIAQVGSTAEFTINSKVEGNVSGQFLGIDSDSTTAGIGNVTVTQGKADGKVLTMKSDGGAGTTYNMQSGDTVTVNGKTFQFARDLTTDTGDNIAVLIGSDGHASLQNLSKALEKEGITNTYDAAGNGKITLEDRHNIAMEEVTTVENTALSLQIGDTGEDFNKMSVSVSDMHAASIGIGDVDISTQEGATAALDQIKNAVNFVSDVRGSLGALQNRLDHTINNLGVMKENIQNAESLIRDTDVAEEMMTYTKNNILNQSAQAMLAQANQLPQGVLQLLG